MSLRSLQGARQSRFRSGVGHRNIWEKGYRVPQDLAFVTRVMFTSRALVL